MVLQLASAAKEAKKVKLIMRISTIKKLNPYQPNRICQSKIKKPHRELCGFDI
jgi:hypothetical protein